MIHHDLAHTPPSTTEEAPTLPAKARATAAKTPATTARPPPYIRKHGLGGAMFWSLDGDTDDGEPMTAVDRGLDRRRRKVWGGRGYGRPTHAQ
ncbi:hypothetical protein [Streptomyces atratus]|uniref:hypothetical protein n=1 Tax=Streptomyces atratus TaxID=1893 RepID=UPI003665530D